MIKVTEEADVFCDIEQEMKALDEKYKKKGYLIKKASFHKKKLITIITLELEYIDNLDNDEL